MLRKELDATPRTLVQVAHAHVEYRTAQDIDVRIADLVDSRQDRRHHRSGHARGPQTLMRVAQRNVDET
jgi:hypothetical protein